MDVSASVTFWDYLDELVASKTLVIDRPKGTRHPRYPEIIYPLDYGYLEGTTSADGDGIDVWLGLSGNHYPSQMEAKSLSAVILTIDLVKQDAELKIMLNCTEEELQTILSFHNDYKMRAILVRRPSNKEMP
jgi:inorganic pyrophosphatase